MRVFEPLNGNFADQQTGLVLFNQFGATVSQDTGRDAQVMSDFFGLPVLAVDRPGTAGIIPHKNLEKALSTPNGYLAEMAPVGKSIDRQADSIGITKLVSTGRSAGGLGALALARTETVSSLSAVFAVEPVACEKMPIKEGVARYSAYLKEQKELLDGASPGEMVKPLPPGLPLFPAISRLVSIPPAALFDRFHNKELFASDAALQYASYIAENLSLIDTTLEFAEHSMVATPEVYEREVRPIANLRQDGAPFKVNQPVGTVHASFDNRQFMNGVIIPTVSRTLTQTTQD